MLSMGFIVDLANSYSRCASPRGTYREVYGLFLVVRLTSFRKVVYAIAHFPDAANLNHWRL